MDGWNTSFLFGMAPIFRCNVSFRECSNYFSSPWFTNLSKISIGDGDVLLDIMLKLWNRLGPILTSIVGRRIRRVGAFIGFVFPYVYVWTSDLKQHECSSRWIKHVMSCHVRPLFSPSLTLWQKRIPTFSKSDDKQEGNWLTDVDIWLCGSSLNISTSPVWGRVFLGACHSFRLICSLHLITS